MLLARFKTLTACYLRAVIVLQGLQGVLWVEVYVGRKCIQCHKIHELLSTESQTAYYVGDDELDM